MCIFSGKVRDVSHTKIFARLIEEEPGWQALAYSMALDAAEPVAMVLPLPIVPGSGEDAVRFVDLSRHARMFDDLAQLFERQDLMLLQGRPTLSVHRVGSFVASYVPAPRDFARLDPQFRVGDAVFAAVPEYADYGFAVFQLAPGVATIHPMGLQFATRAAHALYFPTVHVHDGTCPLWAEFDHALYYQHARARGPIARFGPDQVSLRGAGTYEGLAEGGDPVVRRTLTGTRPNMDTWIDPAAF